MIRVPFFLLFGFDKGTQKQKGQKGTTREPGHWEGIEDPARSDSRRPHWVPQPIGEPGGYFALHRVRIPRLYTFLALLCYDRNPDTNS